MRISGLCVVLIVSLVARCGRAESVPAPLPDHPVAEEVELYGNFETLGVIADVPEGMQPEDLSTMRCAVWRDGHWAAAHELVQVGANPWFATSLFWLKPDTEYLVGVEVLDQAGTAVATWYRKGRTRLRGRGCQFQRTRPGRAAQPYRGIVRRRASLPMAQRLGAYERDRLPR